MHETRKARADVFKISIDIEMVRFDVRHYGNARREREKGSVVLVRLNDEQLVAAVAEVAVPFAHSSTGNSGRLHSSSGERGSRHDSRRRLAMSTGDANHFAVLD